jgi:membrane-bound metal-dependent hydrolase YbcI (DUF457 family)
MAGFKTHLFWGMTGSGILATAGYLQGHIDIKEANAVVILGTLGGLLPDLDSDTSKPLEYLFQLLSVLIPMLLYSFLKDRFSGDITNILLLFAFGYLTMQYFFRPIFKKLTVHRGIMHSIPFALLCGQMTFLLFSEISQIVAFYYAAAVFSGMLLHLIIDEFYAVSFKGVIPRFKRSFGTALSLYSSSLWTTLFIYFLLFFTSYLIVGGNVDISFRHFTLK